ncbi:MAG: hypothetical protein ACI33N_02380 [Desulfovibrionaceae bacterium]
MKRLTDWLEKVSLAAPAVGMGVFWGVWLIIIGYFFHSLAGGR